MSAYNRGLRRDPDDAHAVGASGDGRGDVRAMTLEILDRGLVRAVAIGNFLWIGRRRRAVDERTRPRHVDRTGKVRVTEIDAAIDDADFDAATRRVRRMGRACVNRLNVPLAG